MYVGNLLHAGEPDLLVGESLAQWDVPIVYSLPSHGKLGTVGHFLVDAQNGDIKIKESTPIEETALRNLLRTTDRGTTVTNILMLNASLSGIKAELHEWLLVDLQEYLETKRQPCIATVGTSPLPHWKQIESLHAIVVHGFDDEHIFLSTILFLMIENFVLQLRIF
jgi:uncharacterized protein YvpB